MIQYKINKFTSLLVVLFSATLFSCVKEKTFFETGTGDGNRGTLVKIMEANDVILRARDVAPTLDEFVFIEVRRDPSTQAELNTPLTVTLIKNSAYITSYNAAHATSFTELPAANFTILDNLTITFQPGEFAKQIKIRVNKTGLNLSAQYALAYSISSVSAGKISPDYKNALVQIIIKNKYDGHYKVTGSMVDAANPALGGFHPFECDLETIGANAVVLNPTQGPFAGAYFYPITNGGAASGYGSFTPVFIFNLTTDKVTAVENAWGQPASNGRSGELNPAGVNQWFASDKHMEVSYWMNQPSVIAGHRSTMQENFQYLRPR